ncbi:NB-ARC domain-containing protein [Actinomadura sp. 9N215]|uniref:NB-ARC domain-containing protein n=1 Tax=Actinomadura sp. 9N215 TaxID=3375150 RepID=UPI0037B61C68
MPDETSTGAARPLPERRARLAAPWIVGGLTAVITAVTTSLDALDLAAPVQILVTSGVALLAGIAAWGTQQAPPGGERSADRDEAGSGVAPAQLPPVIAHFTGRDGSLAELRRAVADGSGSPASPLVVSLHGPAGVGKSSLAARFAHEIAAEYPDGCLYFDLRGTGDARAEPEEVLIGFLQALGVRLSTDPGGLPELQKLWWTWTKGRRLLVLLDNARDADQVRALLPPVGGCAVIVTSRQPLHLRNTFDRRLREFTDDTAVELLGRLAGRERIARDPAAAAEIAELCGYLPLAIGICGGRLAARESWTPRAMADRLADERRRAPPPAGRAGDRPRHRHQRPGEPGAQLRRLQPDATPPAAHPGHAGRARRAGVGGGRAARRVRPGGRRPAGGPGRRAARRVLRDGRHRTDAVPPARPRPPLRAGTDGSGGRRTRA